MPFLYDTFDNPFATPIVTTTYYLHLIDTANIAGCISYITDSITITVTPIDTTSKPKPIIISTLLSEGQNWNIQNLPANTSANLYNAIGQLIFTSDNYIKEESYLILAQGMYFYHLKTIDGMEYKGKVMVVK